MYSGYAVGMMELIERLSADLGLHHACSLISCKRPLMLLQLLARTDFARRHCRYSGTRCLEQFLLHSCC